VSGYSAVFRWRLALRDASDLPASAKATGFALSLYLDESGYAFPGVRRLASDTGRNRRTVQRALRTLEEANYLRTQKGGGRERTSRYLIGFPDLKGGRAEKPKRAAEMRVKGVTMPPELDIEEDNNVVVEETLVKLLDKLGFTASQRARALAEDHDRVMAWLERAQEPDVRNPAAFAWSGITSGAWPIPQASEVRGSHGLTVLHEEEESSGPWEVQALNGSGDKMVVVGRFDDLAEARLVYAEYEEKGGATLTPVAA
jgi:hypothetical protein